MHYFQKEATPCAQRPRPLVLLNDTSEAAQLFRKALLRVTYTPTAGIKNNCYFHRFS